MNKYRVTSHVTICVEKEIEASCRDEAIIEFGKQVEEDFGWADYDTVSVEKVGDNI